MNAFRYTSRLILLTVAIVLASTNAGAQKRILWQGTVKPERINVYATPSISDPVTAMLKQGDIVDVILEITVLGNAWCRIGPSGRSEPLGYVLCFNLEKSHFTSKQIAHSEPHATTVPAQPTSANSTSNGAEVVTVNPAVLTNKDVLDMNKIGLPPEVLVAKIKSSPCNFDTSPQRLQQLKLSGLPDLVILAMVQAPVGQPPRALISGDPPPVDNAKPIPPAVTAPSAPALQSQRGDAPPCVILKRMGPADEVTSHLYSFGIRGKQFQFVEGELPKGISFHGRLTDHDVRSIQNRGGKVVVIEPKYTTVDLDHARQECREQ